MTHSRMASLQTENKKRVGALAFGESSLTDSAHAAMAVVAEEAGRKSLTRFIVLARDAVEELDHIRAAIRVARLRFNAAQSCNRREESDDENERRKKVARHYRSLVHRRRRWRANVDEHKRDGNGGDVQIARARARSRARRVTGRSGTQRARALMFFFCAFASVANYRAASARAVVFVSSSRFCVHNALAALAAATARASSGRRRRRRRRRVSVLK